MPQAKAALAFEVRHVQLARAAFAAIAALMITFSSDHSAQVGLSVFSGFAIATALVLFLSAWLVYPSGQRWPVILTGIVTIIAGMAAGIPSIRTDGVFFAIVISWAALSAIIEITAGVRGMRSAERDSQARAEARDTLGVGILSALLAIGIAVVNPAFALEYSVPEAGDFTLTGITIAVGLFGGYAALVAAWLAIAGLSPRKASTPAASAQGGVT